MNQFKFVLNRYAVLSCTGCEEQTACITHGLTCSAIGGHTTEKSCLAASPGNFVAGDVVTPCTAVDNAASITCEAAANSRAVCDVGYFITEHFGSSDTCSGA